MRVYITCQPQVSSPNMSQIRGPQPYSAPLRCYREVWIQGLHTLANTSPKLTKILVRGRHYVTEIIDLKHSRDSIRSFKHIAVNLKHLELEYRAFLCDENFKALGSSSCWITVLDLYKCYRIDNRTLRYLTDGYCSKTIKELNLRVCFCITDSGVSFLQKMCVLEELNLAACDRVTDVGGVAISAIRTLKKIHLWGTQVTDTTIVALAEKCLDLEMLDLRGNKYVTGTGIRAFLGHQCLQVLDLRHIQNSVTGFDLEDLANDCPSLESIVVLEGWRERLLFEMQESTLCRFVRFN